MQGRPPWRVVPVAAVDLDAVAARIHRWRRISGGWGTDLAAGAQIQAAGNGSSRGSGRHKLRERRWSVRKEEAKAEGCSLSPQALWWGSRRSGGAKLQDAASKHARPSAKGGVAGRRSGGPAVRRRPATTGWAGPWRHLESLDELGHNRDVEAVELWVDNKSALALMKNPVFHEHNKYMRVIASKHETDGRVIVAEFESFLLLNTYAPNNGWKEEENSFQRRRKWDKRMLDFVQQVDKPVIWCGDLNVSHEEIDVSHPDFFISAKFNGYIPPNKEDCGQPGFTLSERWRFSNILSQGKLIDAYRYLHKEKDMDCGFSWSGHPIGKYRGKRMRIDYFIVSEKLEDRIVSCEIHGRGIEREGFYGSDHCPVSLEFSEAGPEPKSSN
ncbi:hypothetical protein GUJ93_ZPchr0009g489 [Zizania palustris]|uniref:DNA-(apurinic or apyrimidinic site) endonuclease n=1 Tax=Zizania palustris TaxID=103762 RepID=A0A8J5V4Z8_ZIZPA|nr:hypothetical protein GUJ93_ZPchr0009g489 [Zizania palustris]